jgi:hypothetical protein
MKNLLLSFVGASVFLILAVCVHAGVVPGAFDVPHETANNLQLVRVGFSEDGLLRVSPEPTPPVVSPRLKLGNHQRTLRVFLASGGHDASVRLFVEQARPHQFFEISGEFSLANAPGALYWEDEILLRFLGVSASGVPSVFKVDLRKGVMLVTPLVGQE